MIVWDESGCMDISLTSTRWWHWKKSPNLISFLKCSDILKWVNWIDRVIEAHLLNLVLISVWSWTPSGSTWANTLTLNKLLYWLSLKKSAIAHKAVIFFFYKGEWNDAFVDQFFTVGQREREMKDQLKELALCCWDVLHHDWKVIAVATVLKLITHEGRAGLHMLKHLTHQVQWRSCILTAFLVISDI